MDATQEQWRSVPGHEGHYEVSNLGRVRSLDRVVRNGNGTRLVEGKIRKLQPRPPKGYLSVHFGHAGPRVAVHRLVLESFVGPCPPGQECLHANDIATDNRLVNLRWGTRSENIMDAVSNGTHVNANKAHCKRDHRFTPENTYVNPSSGGRQCRECMRVARGSVLRRPERLNHNYISSGGAIA